MTARSNHPRRRRWLRLSTHDIGRRADAHVDPRVAEELRIIHDARS